MKYGRRSVLRGLAGSTFAASTMRYWLEAAEAQNFPKRFLFVFTNAGRDSESRSTGTGAGFALGPGYAAMQPYQSKLLVVDGLHIPPHTGEEHPCGKAALLTCRKAAKGTWRSTGISFDRYLAGKISSGSSFYTGTYNGPGSGDAGGIANTVSWNGAGSQNDGFLTGSNALMQKLFAGSAALPPAPPGPTGSPLPMLAPAAAAKSQNDTALYDYLMADVMTLKGIAPKNQLEKLELHVQALQQLKSSAARPQAPLPATGTTPATGTPAAPTMVTRQCGTTVDLTGASVEADKISLVIANAFACDRARVGVVRIGSEDPYHNYSHWMDGASYRASMRMIDKQWATNFANLLGYLDSFKEGTGTVLSNTIVVWGSDCCGEFGVGQDSGGKQPGDQEEGQGIHNTGYMPFVLAGGMGGRIKMGQRVLLPGRTSLDLYRTVAQQMGVDASDFGDPVYFRGLLPEILA